MPPPDRAYLREGVFLAHAASPWQRGTNEDINGLLRQYFPERTDLSLHTPDDIRAVEDRLNNRPWKALGWQTAARVFTCSGTINTSGVATITRIRPC
jgi:IS30 family transposase